MAIEGWKTMPVIFALEDPRRRFYNSSPPSALNSLITVPFCEADAIKVPSAFTLSAPIPSSWACIELLSPLSPTTKVRVEKELTIVKDFDRTFERVEKCDCFADGFLSCCNANES
jgi:hypothetical protein